MKGKLNRRKYCECGCGKHIKKDKRFISGHNSRIQTEEIRKKRAASIKRKYDEDPIYKEKQRKSHSGITISPEGRANMSRSRMGIVFSDEHLKNLSIAIKKSFEKPEVLQKRIDAQKKLWKDPKYAEKMTNSALKAWSKISPEDKFDKMRKVWAASGRKPNKPEQAIEKILNELFPGEWRYTGDFTFMVNGKNPDFTNVNGQKKLIEMFGDYWHKDDNPEDRKAIFKEFGYDTLVIWEHELKDLDILISRIIDFHNQFDEPINAEQG